MSDSAIRTALRDALDEAYWQRENLADPDASPEQSEMSIAIIVAAFLLRVPSRLDVGTLLAKVQEIANG